MNMGKWKRGRRKGGKRYGGNKKLRLLLMKDDLRQAKAPPQWMEELLFQEAEQPRDDEEIA